jgi:UDP-glucose 4-epimerase
MPTIGVTGGNGFIGQYVVKELVRQGFDVLVLDHHSAPDNAPQQSVKYFYGDVRDATAVTEFVAHVDGVIHLAAVLGTQETIQNPRPSAETNILGSLNVFEAAAQYDVPVVYAGVGNHWMRTEGAGAYTITKTAVEDFTKTFNKFRGARISVVRPVNAYGPGQSIAAPYGSSKVRKIMPSFVCRALVGDPIELYGGGTQVSDCVYVEDVALTFVTALRYLMEGSEPDTYEVGPTESITVRQVAYLVAQAATKLTGQRSRLVDLPMRPGEVPGATVSADTTKLREKLGVDPDKNFTSLEDGIAATVKYYYENWLPDYLSELR